MKFLTVVTTVATREHARRLARQLVEQGLAACAQISEIESIYRWDGELQQDSEYRILFKTLAAHYDRVEQAIVERHPYDLPAVHAWPVDRIHAPFADWVQARCGEHDDRPAGAPEAR